MPTATGWAAGLFMAIEWSEITAGIASVPRLVRFARYRREGCAGRRAIAMGWPWWNRRRRRTVHPAIPPPPPTSFKAEVE